MRIDCERLYRIHGATLYRMVVYRARGNDGCRYFLMPRGVTPETGGSRLRYWASVRDAVAAARRGERSTDVQS